ncbi:MAG: hypothetical protein EXR91_04470 [Gemmatimonadetes bacterium]|nr:hypothetical protein [Gemmatimonadota bacterium]
MRHIIRALLVSAVVAAAHPGTLHAQALDGVMAAIRNGGGWVSVDIKGGRGSATTLPLPTMGMTLNGCVRVHDAHTGRWRITAHETIADTTLEVNAVPGQGVAFSHAFGLRSQIDVEFVWSEPHDTTLFLWVGLGNAESDPDVCIPKS